MIGAAENGLPLIERVVDEARTALCAEAVGAMDESLKTTVEYLKTRKQFGVAIGSFQTLQHRAADMFVAVEQARSMSMFATMASDFDNAKERATAVAAAKVQIGKSGKFVGQQSIQLHGGIGVFLVPGNAKGVAKKGYPTQDGLHAADITFTGVEVEIGRAHV